MVNCLTSNGEHTRVMHVYRHWGVRRLSSTVTGTPTAPPMAPTQPKHSRRQHDTLPGWSLAPWAASGTWAIELLPLTAMHNLPLTTITDTDTMHWDREYSHMNSMSENIIEKNVYILIQCKSSSLIMMMWAKNLLMHMQMPPHSAPLYVTSALCLFVVSMFLEISIAFSKECLNKEKKDKE